MTTTAALVTTATPEATGASIPIQFQLLSAAAASQDAANMQAKELTTLVDKHSRCRCKENRPKKQQWCQEKR